MTVPSSTVVVPTQAQPKADWFSRAGARHGLGLRALMLVGCLLLGLGIAAQAQTTPGALGNPPAAESANSVPGGPVRLVQPPAVPAAGDLAADPLRRPAAPMRRYVQGEFERFVQRQAGDQVEIRRFGAELMIDGGDSSGDLSPLVPADYLVAPGDEVLINLWGSVDANLRLTVDRGGRIVVPRVGTVQVGGLRAGDLQGLIERRVAEVFRNFNLSVTMGQLRGLRVFVTGFVVNPGTYNVSSLSTIVSALMRAGGPSASGSYRNIQLHRGGRVIATFDLYDLLLKGDRSADRILQSGDVVHVLSVGPQIGIVGSVNQPTVLELKSGETVADVLKIAGGFSAVADRSRLAVERLLERSDTRVTELKLPEDLGQLLSHGDVLHAFSAVNLAQPTQRRSKRVRVEGEVTRPSEYVMAESSSVRDAIRAAGGLTPNAFVFATEFTRESVRATQQENYDRALRDMETDFVRGSASRRTSTTEDGNVESARAQSLGRLMERLRALKPSGRIVLQVNPESVELPDLALEDGDRIFIPARPTTVGVFGSVFNPSSYLYQPGRSLDDYLTLAGGPTKGADENSIFVVRANGHVISQRQSRSWFKTSEGVRQVVAHPGDTVFVPEEIDKITFVQGAKDWTQILYQFGVGLAGIVSAFK